MYSHIFIAGIATVDLNWQTNDYVLFPDSSMFLAQSGMQSTIETEHEIYLDGRSTNTFFTHFRWQYRCW